MKIFQQFWNKGKGTINSSFFEFFFFNFFSFGKIDSCFEFVWWNFRNFDNKRETVVNNDIKSIRD